MTGAFRKDFCNGSWGRESHYRHRTGDMIPEIKPRATQQPHHALLEQSEAKAPQSGTYNAAHMGRLSARWPARRRRDAWFLWIILLVGIVTLFVLSGSGGRGSGQANGTPSASSPAPITTASAESGTPAAVAIAHPAQIHLYPFPSNVGLMQPAIDTQGNIWVVEQGANYIGRFDPARQTFQTFSLGTVNGHPMGPQDLQFDA